MKSKGLLIGAALFVAIAEPGMAQSNNYFPPRPGGKSISDVWFPGEAFQTANTITAGQYRYRVGRTPEGFSYTIFPDGSGSVQAPGESWSIGCAVDAMTDERNCSVSNYESGLFIFFGSKNDPSAVCVIGNDFPGRSGAIRIDSFTPHVTDTDGCIKAGSILSELSIGQLVRTRAVKWPYDHGVDRQGPVRGLKQAFALVRHIQQNISKLNF